MAEEILIIDATLNAGWPGETASPHHEQLDEYPSVIETDWVSADNDIGDEPGYVDTFRLPDCTDLGAADTVSSLQVIVWCQAGGTSIKTLRITVENADGSVSDDVTPPAKPGAYRTSTFANAPGVVPWTLARINSIVGVSIEPVVSGKDGDDDNWVVKQLYVKVNYTPAPTGGPRGPLGHPLNGPFRGPI